jgi:hypothetical protein
MNPSQRSARFLDFRFPTLWLAVASLLVVCGLGWRWVDFSGSDAGPVNERVREMRAYSEAIDPAAAGNLSWMSDPALAAGIWKHGWLALNGQWDTRVVAAASTALHAGAWALLLAFVAVRLREVWHCGLVAMVAVAVLLMPRAGEFWTSGATAWSGWLILLSILQLGTQCLERAGRGVWWLGLGAGLANVLGAAGGGAAALVLALAAVFTLRRPESRSRQAWRQLIASGGLVGLSSIKWVQSGGVAAIAEGGGWVGISDFFCWPHGSLWAVGLLLLPAALWLFQAVRKPEVPEKRGVLSVMAGWSLLQPVTIACAGVQTGAAAWGVVGTAVLINAVCLGALAARWGRRPMALAAVFTLWALGAAQALFQVGIDRDDTAVFHETERWRLAWIENDATALGREMERSVVEAEAVLALKSDAKFREILPPSLRAPLVLAPSEGEAPSGFRRGGAPTLKGEAVGLEAWGTWSGGGAPSGRTGEFVSEPLTTTHAMLRLWVAGEWRSGGMTVMLRTESGQEILPLLQPPALAERWVRVNFDAPAEPFRVVVKQTDPAGWVAFAGAVEAGRLSWLFPKVVGFWPWLVGASALAGVMGLVMVAWTPGRRERLRARGSDDGARVTKLMPWLALGVYVAVIAQGMAPAAGGADSSGYLNAARMFSEGRVAMPVREVAGITAEEFGQAVFTPLAFKNTVRPGEITTLTAIGMPLLYALAATIMPLSMAVPVVILANVVLGIVFTRLIAEAFGLSRRWAWVAAGILGLSPLYLFMGLQAMSDGASLTWVTVAVYSAWSSRTRPGYAWLAGIATAMAVLIRPSNFLCVVPVLVCLVGSWRTVLFWALGGVPGALIQLWHSWRVWGNPLVTGYGNVGDAFGVEFVPLSLASYATWLPAVLTPVVVLGLGMPFMRSVPMRVRLVLVTWVAVFGGFYAIFRHTHETWWYLRFILPVFPALIVSALLMLRRIVARWKWPALSPQQRRGFAQLGAIFLLGFLLLGVRGFLVFFWLRGDRAFERAAVWLKENVPADSTVIAAHGGGSVVYYTDLPVILFYQEVVRESPRFAEALAAGGKPVYAMVFHFEAPNGRPDFLGAWDEVARFNDGQIKIWRWADVSATSREFGRDESSLPSTPGG